MKRFGVVILLLVYVNATPLDQKEVRVQDFQKFLAWEQEYQPNFVDATERNRRFEVFRQNLREIERLNERYPHTTFGPTKFATWTRDEFHKILLPIGSSVRNAHPPSDSSVEYKPPTVRGPTYFDWRTKNVITSVKDQKDCGSCWAFASTGAIEAQHAIKSGILVDLSEQQLIDCEWVSQGCSFGFLNTAYDYVRDNGQLKAAAYPYTDNRTKCEKNMAGERVFIDGHRFVTPDENAIATYISTKGPSAFAIVCPDSMMHYKGGVLEIENCLEESVGLHAMLLVGYSPDFWIIKNQWGEDWGEKGYIRFKRGINMCDMTLQVDAPFIN